MMSILPTARVEVEIVIVEGVFRSEGDASVQHELVHRCSYGVDSLATCTMIMTL